MGYKSIKRDIADETIMLRFGVTPMTMKMIACQDKLLAFS